MSRTSRGSDRPSASPAAAAANAFNAFPTGADAVTAAASAQAFAGVRVEVRVVRVYVLERLFIFSGYS